VLLVTEPSKAREIARQAMAFYLPPSNYRNNWKRLGFTDEDLDDGGTNWFLDAMVAWGTETAVKQRIQAHFEAGASHVCIQPLHPQGQPISDYNALTALAPIALQTAPRSRQRPEMGHQDQFPPPTLGGGFRFRKRSSAADD
jgi:hypothetical protein